jgi:glutathione S-transferase
MAESKTPEYLALNPNGRIPVLVDGDLVLFESMAINLYLAKKYGGDLYPRDEADEARANQWSNVARWLGACTSRPSLARAQAKA